MPVPHHRPSSTHILSQSTHELLREYMFPSGHLDVPPPSVHLIHDLGLASRRFDHRVEIRRIAQGAHPHLTLRNICLTYEILRVHTMEMFRMIWVPRTSLVFFFSLYRGPFPAFRGHSQALVIDEVRLFITRGRADPSAHI